MAQHTLPSFLSFSLFPHPIFSYTLGCLPYACGHALPPHATVCFTVVLASPLLTAAVTLLQVEDINAGYARYRGMWHAFTTIAREEGALALYRGVTPNVVRVALLPACGWHTLPLAHTASGPR